jgi:hypothetical protein
MALYKYTTYLSQVDHAEFDKTYSPGSTVPWSGIYRCINCGHEAVHTHEKPLPPQNHHTHATGKGPIQWKLVVTDSRPPSP